MIRLSKSKIGTFETCPYRYKVKYVDGWKPDVLPEQLVKGIEIHDAIDTATKGANAIGTVIDNLKQHELYSKYEEHFKNIIGYQQSHLLPLAHEIELYDPEYHFIGKIDRIQIDEKGVTVYDYKTGKLPMDYKTKKPVEKPATKYKFELYAYAWLVEKHLGLKVDMVGIMFTEHDVIDRIPYDRTENKFVFDKFQKTLDDINKCENKKFFQKRKSGLCFYCELFQNGKCEGTEKVPSTPKK